VENVVCDHGQEPKCLYRVAVVGVGMVDVPGICEFVEAFVFDIPSPVAGSDKIDGRQDLPWNGSGPYPIGYLFLSFATVLSNDIGDLTRAHNSNTHSGLGPPSIHITIPDLTLYSTVRYSLSRCVAGKEFPGLNHQISSLVFEYHDAMLMMFSNQSDKWLLSVKSVCANDIKGFGIVCHDALEQSRGTCRFSFSHSLYLDIQQKDKVFTQQYCGNNSAVGLRRLTLAARYAPG